MRFSVGKRRRIPSVIIVSIFIGIIVLSTFWMMETHLKPTLLAIAEAKALDMS